jgi:hypothetical protein
MRSAEFGALMQELNISETLLVVEYLLLLDCPDPEERARREEAFVEHLFEMIEESHGEGVFCRQGSNRQRCPALNKELNRVIDLLTRCRNTAYPDYRGTFTLAVESLEGALTQHCVECERRAALRVFLGAIDSIVPGSAEWLEKKLFGKKTETFKPAKLGDRRGLDHPEESGAHAAKHHRRAHEVEAEARRDRKTLSEQLHDDIEIEELEEHERIEARVKVLESELNLCQQIIEGERDPQHPKERLTGARREQVLARIGELRIQILALHHRDQYD